MIGLWPKGTDKIVYEDDNNEILRRARGMYKTYGWYQFSGLPFESTANSIVTGDVNNHERRDIILLLGEV